LARARDAAEAREASAPENVEENRFDLIVGGVGGGDVASAEIAGSLGEEIVAGLPGGGFEAVARVGSQIGRGVADRVFEAELFSECANEGCVGVGGLSAKVMVEMGDNDAAFAEIDVFESV
jgi:hypothetical protein